MVQEKGADECFRPSRGSREKRRDSREDHCPPSEIHLGTQIVAERGPRPPGYQNCRKRRLMKYKEWILLGGLLEEDLRY